MKAYKGFNPQPDGTLKCLDKIYEAGGTYTEPKAKACSYGMHACTDPLQVFWYYPAATSVFHEVEVDDSAVGDGKDSKVASKTLTIGASLDVFGIFKVGLDLLWKRVGAARSDAEEKVKLAQGTAAASGDRGTAAASGYQGTAAVSGSESVALAAGYMSRAKGAQGCVLSLVERADYDEDYRILDAKSVIVGRKTNGHRIKPDTWYSLRGGKVVEVDDAGEVVA